MIEDAWSKIRAHDRHSSESITKKVVRRGKLLFFVTEDWYFVSHRLQLAIAAQRAGYRVSVVTRVREHGDAILMAGLKLIPFEISRSGFNPVTELWALIRLILLYRRERPDIVHHVAMKPVLYGTIAARVFGTPRVINALAGMGWLFTSSTWLAQALKSLVRLGLRRLLRYGIALVQNPDDVQLLVHLGVSESCIRRIAGSGVDLHCFVVRPEPDGIPVVVLSARLLWEKGVGEFVAASQLLRRRDIVARFVLAGIPDATNPSCVSFADINSWVQAGIVEHMGWVTDMPRFLAMSHIVCLPSYREGLPKCLVEAAAAGRPIVTTDVPGCREVVHDGDNGLLVPSRDVEALAQALARLIKNPALRRRMGARGRIRAEREFSLETVIQQTLALYAEVMS